MTRPIPKPAPRAPAERDVLADIRLALGQEPDLVLWRLSQGAGVLVRLQQILELIDLLRTGRPIEALRALEALAERFTRQGMIPGAADLIGILSVPGMPCAAACSSCKGRGWHVGECHPREVCGDCDGNGRARALLGRFIALEVKRPAAPGRSRGRTSDDQDQWLALVRRMGGFAAVVSSVDEARAALARARRGESE